MGLRTDEGIPAASRHRAMGNLLIGLALVSAAILNWRFDLLQKYQRQLTKSPLGERPVMRFSNRYFASAFMIFFGVFWIVITAR
jgi:hypothetical protein